MITARKAGELESAAAVLKQAGIDVDWVAADFSKETDIKALAAEAVRPLWHVNTLVNNAGSV